VKNENEKKDMIEIFNNSEDIINNMKEDFFKNCVTTTTNDTTRANTVFICMEGCQEPTTTNSCFIHLKKSEKTDAKDFEYTPFYGVEFKMYHTDDRTNIKYVTVKEFNSDLLKYIYFDFEGKSKLFLEVESRQELYNFLHKFKTNINMKKPLLILLQPNRIKTHIFDIETTTTLESHKTISFTSDYNT